MSINKTDFFFPAFILNFIIIDFPKCTWKMKNLTCQSNPKPLQCPRGQILGSTFRNCTKRGEKVNATYLSSYRQWRWWWRQQESLLGGQTQLYIRGRVRWQKKDLEGRLDLGPRDRGRVRLIGSFVNNVIPTGQIMNRGFCCWPQSWNGKQETGGGR